MTAHGLPRHILLATDLTPSSDRAFDRAVALAGQWRATLTVVHVIPSAAARPWGIEQRIKNAETELGRLVTDLGATPSPPTKIERQLLVGDPAARTIEFAEKIGADLIITGPARQRVFGDTLLGSTAARIVQRAFVPVLAVRRRPLGPYRSVIAATDFSAVATTALLRARAMFPAAALTAVAVPVVAPDWTGPEADKPLDEVVAGARDEAIAAVKQDLADLVARVAKASPDAPMIATAIVEGTPPVALASYVETAWPDLLVCGTHGRTGREGRGGAGSEGVGSVAEALLSTLPCDVLVAPDTA